MPLFYFAHPYILTGIISFLCTFTVTWLLIPRLARFGYGRAARMIDRMEDEGIIGSDRGVGKPREVLVGEE